MIKFWKKLKCKLFGHKFRVRATYFILSPEMYEKNKEYYNEVYCDRCLKGLRK